MRWTGLLALTAAAACAAPDAPSADVLMEADRAFARAVAANGTESWVTAFAENGMMFDGSQPVVGHEAIRGFMSPAFDSGTFTLSWDPLEGEIAVSGDMGYTRGRWESRRQASDGAEQVGSGTYVTIWRRGGDGQWRVALDIGAADEPPAPTVP